MKRMTRTPTRRLFAWALTVALLGPAGLSVQALAQEPTAPPPGPAERALRSSDRLNGPAPMPAPVPAEPLATPVTEMGREVRTYPEQPPVIPHDIEGYELSLNANKCLTCHKREYIEASGAPMISVTHYQNREGQMLADVSPRRYFCTQCHVPQTTADPLVENTFTDMKDITAGSGTDATGGR